VRLALLTFGIFSSLATATYGQSTSQPPSSDAPIATAARAEAAKAAPAEPAAPADTAAQSPEPGTSRTRLQLGVSLKQTFTPGIDTGSSLKPTFVWRWRGKGSRTDDRWAPAYRLSSFSSQVSTQMGSNELPVGDVKVRPLMLGLDYKMPRGKWNWAAGMSVGWAMNDVTTPGEYTNRVLNTVGADDLWVDVHNSLVWGPRLKGWFERDRRLSYMVEAAYLVTRPELDVRVNGVTTSRRINADALILKAGIVYGIF
jgi:hypothetical protein